MGCLLNSPENECQKWLTSIIVLIWSLIADWSDFFINFWWYIIYVYIRIKQIRALNINH